MRECNELLPALYKLHATWFRLNQRPTETLPPPVIQPLTNPTWKYVSPTSLATSGIYSSDDLDRLRNHIMFPVEKPSMLNTLAKGAMGQYVPPGSFDMNNLLDEKALERIAESTGKKIWRGFTNFGSISAGVLGIILILRLIMLIFDTIIHGYALHTVYGWSLHLLGAVWSSVTHLLLHLARSPNGQQPKDKADPANEELQPQKDLMEGSAPEKEENTSNDNDNTMNYSKLRTYLSNV